MREFFDADEAAVELQRLTKLEWTAAQVLREAENGNLPICFQHQGKIGVFNRQESELGQSIFGKALRTTYLPRGSYLRVQGHPVLTNVHQKPVSLSSRNLELAKSARGASEVSVTPSETLRIVSESGGFKDNAAMLLVPSTEWLFHADDLSKFAPAPAPRKAKPAQPGAAVPAPVVAEIVRSAPRNGKVWTPERLAHAKEYRGKHGTKKTAEYFGVSEQLIRQKLPSEKPIQKGFSAFTHRSK